MPHRSAFLTINRPEWQANLPRGLRIAAEWQFGTFILASILAATRTGEFVGIPVSLAFSFIMFLILSGWAQNKRVNSPIVWWTIAIGFGLLGALGIVVLIVDPPD